MHVIVTQYGITILSSSNLKMLPRIGESMWIDRNLYEVKDVIWHTENELYVEIKIE